MPEPNKTDDRFMICGGPDMLKQTCEILDGWGFEQSEKRGFQADYVIERAFVVRLKPEFYEEAITFYLDYCCNCFIAAEKCG